MRGPYGMKKDNKSVEICAVCIYGCTVDLFLQKVMVWCLVSVFVHRK